MAAYSFDGDVAFYGHIPETVTVTDGVVTGELSKTQVKAPAWTVPPHVAFANLSLEPRAVSAFTKTYGPISVPIAQYADGVRGLREDGQVGSLGGGTIDPSLLNTLLSHGGDEAVRETFAFSIDDFRELQTRFRLAWRGERTIIQTISDHVTAANFQVWHFGKGAVEKISLRTRSLWSFICLVFLIDHDTDKVRICANRLCATPYFLRQRADQECCSHRCAVARNNARRVDQKRSKR
jgi:hypothetical protein